MNRNVSRKLVIEPALRGGGWKATELHFRFRYGEKPLLVKEGSEFKFATFAGAAEHAKRFYCTRYKPRPSL
jgi:hypothetical protein